MSRQVTSVLWGRLFPFIHWLPRVNRESLRDDVIAGLTNAVIVLPHGRRCAAGGYLQRIGEENLFATKSVALHTIFARLDKDICRRCDKRIFNECQSIEKQG